MATKAATRRGRKKSDPEIPVERDEKALDKARAEHQKTLEGSEPVDVNEALGVGTEEASKIFAREREILDEKLTDSAAQQIAFNHLAWGDNVRTGKTLQLETMIHSLKTRGYNPKYPIVVSKKSGSKFLVLCGNRRTEALKRIKESEPEIFKIILPDGKIPALVLDDLTEDEEIIIRNDHSTEEDRVALDDEGLFYSVKQLVKAGYSSQNDLAAKLNLFIEDRNTKQLVPNRSFIQQRVNLARLPKEVQDEYLTLMRDGKNSTDVRWSQVAKLFKVFMEGRRKGFLDGGEEFKQLWESCKNPEKTDEDSKDGSKSKMLTKTETEQISEKLGSRLGQLFLLKVAGNPVMDPETEKPLDWGDIDGEMVKAEQALTDLNDIANHLGKREFGKLMTEITKKRQAEAKATDDAA